MVAVIRALLAIQLGLSVAVVFAILEALAPPPKQRRMTALTQMIADLDRTIEAQAHLEPLTPAEVTEAERLLDLAPFEMELAGYYGGWPFDTIGEDSAN